MSLLIVEEGWATLESLEMIVNEVVPQHFPYFEEGGYDVAKCYSDAEEMMSQNNYGIILLDHRIPKKDQGRLDNIGYNLIPIIRQKSPTAYIIGTSDSPSAQPNLHKLDYSLDKMNFKEAQSKLDYILNQIDGDISHLMGYKKE